MPLAPMTDGTPQKMPFSLYSPSKGALAAMIFRSSRRTARTMVAPVMLMPYSVQPLPEYVTQPALMVCSWTLSLSKT